MNLRASISFARLSIVRILAIAVGFAVTAESFAAFPTAVNSSLTDAVTQANVQVLGSNPSLTMANLYQSSAQAIANSVSNTTVAPQQSMLLAQAGTTQGVATLYSIDTASSALATKTILGTGTARAGLRSVTASLPAEGILGGVSLLMFNIEGLAHPFADYYVITDQGFDYYLDRDQNLILFAHQVRTIGDAPSEATDVGFLLTPPAIARYFPQLLESPSGATARLASTASDPLRDIYFGVKYADGSTTFYEASLKLPITSVPEPSPFILALGGLMMVGARRWLRASGVHAGSPLGSE